MTPRRPVRQGLVGTAADYLRFCTMLLNRGTLDGVRVLGRKTVEYMTTNHLPTGGDLVTMGRPVFSETERQRLVELMRAAGFPACAKTETLARSPQLVQLPECHAK